MKRVVTYYELCRQLPASIDIPDEKALRYLCWQNGVEFDTMHKDWECHRQRLNETLASLNAPATEQIIELELLLQDDKE